MKRRLSILAIASMWNACGGDLAARQPTPFVAGTGAASAIAAILSFTVEPNVDQKVGQEIVISARVANPCVRGRHLTVTLEQRGVGVDAPTVTIADIDETSACADVTTTRKSTFNSPGIRTFRLRVLETGPDLTNGKTEVSKDLVISVNSA